MVNWQELKDNKISLRIIVQEIYQESLEEGVFRSIREMAQDVGVPYTSFRMYMKGRDLSDKNLLKVRKWVDNIV